MSHRRLALAGLVLAHLATAGPAHATTLVSKSGGELVASAATGRANTISVSLVGSAYFVTDAGDTVAPVAGSGCMTAGNPNTVSCPQFAVGRVAVTADDLNDTVTVATPTTARIDGGPGDDVLNAGPVAGSASLAGGPGTDMLLGGPSADVLDGGAGADVLDGGSGVDRAEYSARAAGVTVTVDGVANDGEAGEGDNVKTTVENLYGGDGNDALTGGGGPNLLSGRGGADTLNGLAGTDTLIGGPGGDVLNGGGDVDTFLADAGPDGADVFNGGAGSADHVDYSARSARVTVDLDGVADDGAAGEGDNAKADVEQLTGGTASDLLTGSAGANVLDGGDGSDGLYGLAGNDRLRGQAGDDDLDGGPGNDFLDAGAGEDYLLGGPGSDGLRGGDGDDFLAGPRDGDGDSLHGGPGADECGGDQFDSKTSCEGQ